MYGCGHDGHMAMLVGAARYLAETRNFAGDAVLVFQPPEEGRGGAEAMIRDGLFDRFPVQAIYAMHNWLAMQPDTIGINAGPILVAAHRIIAVQSIVSLNVKALDNVVRDLESSHGRGAVCRDRGAFAAAGQQTRFAMKTVAFCIR